MENERADKRDNSRDTGRSKAVGETDDNATAQWLNLGQSSSSSDKARSLTIGLSNESRSSRQSKSEPNIRSLDPPHQTGHTTINIRRSSPTSTKQSEYDYCDVIPSR